MRKSVMFAVLLAATVLVGACSGGADSSKPPATSRPTTTTSDLAEQQLAQSKWMSCQGEMISGKVGFLETVVEATGSLEAAGATYGQAGDVVANLINQERAVAQGRKDACLAAVPDCAAETSGFYAAYGVYLDGMAALWAKIAEGNDDEPWPDPPKSPERCLSLESVPPSPSSTAPTTTTKPSTTSTSKVETKAAGSGSAVDAYCAKVEELEELAKQSGAAPYSEIQRLLNEIGPLTIEAAKTLGDPSQASRATDCAQRQTKAVTDAQKPD